MWETKLNILLRYDSLDKYEHAVFVVILQTLRHIARTPRSHEDPLGRDRWSMLCQGVQHLTHDSTRTLRSIDELWFRLRKSQENEVKYPEWESELETFLDHVVGLLDSLRRGDRAATMDRGERFSAAADSPLRGRPQRDQGRRAAQG
ncbi:hypothetical protein FHETE_2108 [Fusarium heterosporum]|uniref:Uncharacterized protein n=1 Tax=Fusarium heterosporum TaxID=42747 RepID=A0A8H5TYH9_FUSHE|nr:hypothetical protein FHETE_2108 [Fusarium heterosporum]